MCCSVKEKGQRTPSSCMGSGAGDPFFVPTQSSLTSRYQTRPASHVDVGTTDSEYTQRPQGVWVLLSHQLVFLHSYTKMNTDATGKTILQDAVWKCSDESTEIPAI